MYQCDNAATGLRIESDGFERPVCNVCVDRCSGVSEEGWRNIGIWWYEEEETGIWTEDADRRIVLVLDPGIERDGILEFLKHRRQKVGYIPRYEVIHDTYRYYTVKDVPREQEVQDDAQGR